MADEFAKVLDEADEHDDGGACQAKQEHTNQNANHDCAEENHDPILVRSL